MTEGYGEDWLHTAKHHWEINSRPEIIQAAALIAIAEELRLIWRLLDGLATDEVGKADEYL